MADKRQEDNERVGSIAGLGAGVIAGAQIGTFLIPIPVIGTFTGALVGGVLGSEVGKSVGSAMLKGLDAFTSSLNQPPSRGPDDPPGGSAG